MTKNLSDRGSGPARMKSAGRATNHTAWILAIVAAAVVMYGPTLCYMWTRWQQDRQYSLAFLVPPICVYFIWKLWPQASATERRPSLWGLVLIVLGLLMHLVSIVLDVALISDISMIVCVVGGCLYLRGKQFTKVMWFPLAYTLFAIPVPDGLIDLVAFPMQLWASTSTAHLLQALHIDVIQVGVNLNVSGFSCIVAEECSGMSSLVALVGVTAVFAYLTDLRPRLKWLLFLLSLPIALIANTVRIATIALVAYFISSDAAMDIYHDWSSPIVFVVSILLLFLINRGLEWLSARRTTH